ncbi:MAG: hypothetical protein IKH41_10670, partial [Clostridia bacterium]|nr:hypothetical protein [Clostridia bacterium]
EPAWHTKPEKTDLCAKVDRNRLERQRPAGTQNSKKLICVPKLTANDLRDSARLAHKTQKKTICVPKLTNREVKDSAAENRL